MWRACGGENTQLIRVPTEHASANQGTDRTCPLGVARVFGAALLVACTLSLRGHMNDYCRKSLRRVREIFELEWRWSGWFANGQFDSNPFRLKMTQLQVSNSPARYSCKLPSCSATTSILDVPWVQNQLPEAILAKSIFNICKFSQYFLKWKLQRTTCSLFSRSLKSAGPPLQNFDVVAVFRASAEERILCSVTKSDGLILLATWTKWNYLNDRRQKTNSSCLAYLIDFSLIIWFFNYELFHQVSDILGGSATHRERNGSCHQAASFFLLGSHLQAFRNQQLTKISQQTAHGDEKKTTTTTTYKYSEEDIQARETGLAWILSEQ